MIVKIQRALLSYTTELPYLVYNQDQSLQWEDLPTPNLEEVMGNRVKVYAQMTGLNPFGLSTTFEIVHPQPTW